MSTNGATPWFEVSVEGLRKTLERKGKVAAIYELVQNSWARRQDETDLIEFDKPQSGVSVEDDLNELEIQPKANEALEEDRKFAQAVDIDFDAVGAL